MSRNIVLLTGATGRIGPHVLDALLEAGYPVRVATPDQPARVDDVDWIKTDFRTRVNYDALVQGVSYVVHLAAELSATEYMWRVNADASGLLAEAAERAGVKTFLYSSSVGVYGHPPFRTIDESTPVMSLDPTVDNRFLDKAYLYDYCVTKLAGEHRIGLSLNRTRNLTMRFSNVVSELEISRVLTWPMLRKVWRGGRRTHQIYVKDVAAAVKFLLQCEVAGRDRTSKNDIFIISSDHEPENSYLSLFRRKALADGLPPWMGCPIWMPAWLDRIKDRLKYRRWSIGWPAGAVNYSPQKLLNMGFRYPHGILSVQNRVISRQSPARSSGSK